MDLTPKLNVDGASKLDPGEEWSGGLLRDKDNSLIFSFSGYLGHGTKNFVELKALYIGMLMCYQLYILKVHVETYSQLIANSFSSKKSPHWKLKDIWKNIMQMGDIIDLKVHHIYR